MSWRKKFRGEEDMPFTKKGETSFVKNEAGKVIATEHLGDQPRESRSKSPVTKALMKGYYKEHPEKTKTARAIKLGKATGKHATTVGKAVDKWAVNYNRRQGGRRRPAAPLASYSFRNNYNPFGSMFDTGMTRPKKSKTKYANIGGKAYPIASTMKKKKKKKKSSTRTSSGFDMFDNSGFFR